MFLINCAYVKLMVIQKRLIQITVMVILFSVFLVFGLFQMAKGAHFHKLNSLHLKYIVELKAKLNASDMNSGLDVDSLSKTVLDIRAQPIACLDLINGFDRLIMRLIQTDNAITLCENDIVTADETLIALRAHKDGSISQQQIYATLIQAAKVFTSNSDQFEAPIDKTVEFIVASTLISFCVISLLMATAMVYATSSISKSITEMTKASKALEESERLNRKLAHYDSLTNLPNRNLFLDRLKYQLNLARRNNTKVVLLFVDLDRFKVVNDSMGHQAGDDLICEMGRRLVSCVRDSDVVARIGGDEFNVILSNISKVNNVVIVVERIIKKLAEQFTIKNQTVFVSASVGIAVYPDDANNTGDLRKYADLAMYQVKEKGRNSYEFYSKDLDQKVNERIKNEQRLHHALERNEFLLHYQPVVRLSDMRIVGAEALLRWQQPEVGLVSPLDFIPLAEELGLIVEIGDWVLRQACKMAKTWSTQSEQPFRVAVNVSVYQLRSKGFSKSVEHALQEADLPASLLDIEITESLMIEQDEVSLNNLQQLSSLGVRLLLDDFGAGHSSLSYLHKLPFDILKIDRSFISNLDEKQESKKMISSVIAIAHQLDLQVIAEGLETEPSLTLLKELNCEFSQGYLFNRPVPPEEIDCNKVYSV